MTPDEPLNLTLEATMKQDAYAAYRAAWRAEVAEMEPYKHPLGSPSTPFVLDPLAVLGDQLDAEVARLEVVAAYRDDPVTGWKRD